MWEFTMFFEWISPATWGFSMISPTQMVGKCWNWMDLA
jgi:hypothetical protein